MQWNIHSGRVDSISVDQVLPENARIVSEQHSDQQQDGDGMISIGLLTQYLAIVLL